MEPRSNKVNQQDLFTSAANANYKAHVKTHSRSALARIDKQIHWEALLQPIEQVVSKERPQTGKGRKPFSLKTIVKCFILQYMYGLSDPKLEEEIFDRRSFQIFLDINSGDSVPDETTICRYRELFARLGLDKVLFESLNKQLRHRNLILERVTIVDATIIDTVANPNSGSDTDATHTKKRNKSYYGYKGHIGTDAGTGVIHSLEFTTASVHDSQVFDELLTGKELAVYADKGYASRERSKQLESKGIESNILEKGKRNKPLTKEQIGKNKQLSSVRNRVERPFAYMKRVLGYSLCSYFDIARNRMQFVISATIYNMRRMLSLTIA